MAQAEPGFAAVALASSAAAAVGGLRSPSFSPLRFTQITGTFIFKSGATSVSYPLAMCTQPFLPPIRRAHSLKCAGSGL